MGRFPPCLLRFLGIYTLAIGTATEATADNWPAWRGPTGQGHCSKTNLPLKWSITENVKWKVAMPAPGNSTPIIWGERIFITQSNKECTKRGLMCLDRADGKLLWRHEIDYPEKERGVSPPYYPCAASPTTDGERVVVSYGSAGMYCYDFAGKVLWKRDDLGKWTHTYGNASSPVLHGDLAILWCGPDAKHTRLLAVNKKTGATVWEHKERNGSWSTPFIARIDGRDELHLSMPDGLKGFDPHTGTELWRCDGLTELVYNSPLYAPDPSGKGGIAVAMSGYGGAALAVKLGGSGDITKDRLWHHPRNTQRVGSGVIVGEHVYILEENTVPHCYELRTGKEVWKPGKRLGAVSWSSMVVSGDRIYALCQNGDTHVFATSPKYQLLATNQLGGEYTNASIVVSGGELFIRTWEHLWCIRELGEGPKERPLKVFVLAGTSNMLGAPAKIDKLPEELRQPMKEVLVYQKGEWTPLEAGKNLVGNEATFGRSMAKHLGEPVGIFWISVASTSGNSPGASINNIVKQSRDKGRPIVIAGMLLDVSYRDGNKEETAKAYGENLVRWVESTRKDLDNPNLPIVMNRAIPPGKGNPYLELVRKAQDSAKIPNFRVFDCDDVPRGGDKVHFQTEGRLELGKRFAAEMIDLTKARQ